MAVALSLARRGLGNVWPNPAVGCVIVAPVAEGRAPRVLGRGWTQPGGRPHAETEALTRAAASNGADALAGAVAYVTLEPCNHSGKTPPCTEALIEAGIGTVVVACEDSDPRVSGAGLARLRDAGLTVRTGIAEAAARDLNAGFLMRVHGGRPLVTLKTATTLDGRIATAAGASRWVTGAAARERAHLLRAQYDAILVGSETVLRDDPRLDCRLPGLGERSPVRVVVDSRLRLTPDRELARETGRWPTWVLTTAPAGAENAAPLRAAGVEVLSVAAAADGRVDLATALLRLGERGLTRLLVEGGAEITAALLAADLVDRIAWFRAPSLIGGDGLPVSQALGVTDPGAAPRFARPVVPGARRRRAGDLRTGIRAHVYGDHHRRRSRSRGRWRRVTATDRYRHRVRYGNRCHRRVHRLQRHVPHGCQ